MKNIIKYMCLSLSFGLLLTSCDDNEDYTGGSVLDYKASPITVTSSEASYTFNEANIDEDEPSTYTVTLSASIEETQPVDAYVTFSQTDGTADENDYSVGSIKIPAGATSGSTTVEVNYTGDIEGSESFTLMAKTIGNFTLASDFSVTINIEDKINDILELSTNWSGEKTIDIIRGSTATLDFCDIDIDVLLYTDTGVLVQYLGATLDCPEKGSISGLADGDYYIVLQVYSNPLADFGSTDALPVTITYNQEHFISGSFVHNSLNLSSQGDLIAVASLKVSGYNYTVEPL
jgi:hypothetical protein